MRLKKTLYAVVVLLAVASMVVPGVRADVRRPKGFVFDRNFMAEHREQLVRAQQRVQAGEKLRTPRGRSKALPNNGLLKAGSGLDKYRDPNYVVPRLEADILLGRDLAGSANKRMDASFEARLRSSEPVQLTPERRAQLNLRASGAPSETAADRVAKKARAYAEAKRELARGTSSTADVLPSAQIADGSALSAIGFCGISGTEDFFDEAVLLGDLDGNMLLDDDFGSAGLNPRTAVDRQGKVVDDILLPDEVYTAMAVSGHNAANGFNAPTDFNVFYTGTNAGFLSIEGDTVCDGDLLADTSLGVVALTGIAVPGTGSNFSNSASITGIAVTEAEYDGDLATDEVVYFSVFDPEFGRPAAATSALCVMLDSDGDDIPDPGLVIVLSLSSNISVAGVATDSFGDAYWQLTDFIIGRIVKFFDVDEDRLPDFTTLWNLTDQNLTGVVDISILQVSNAVDIAVDRSNTVYLQCANGAEPGVPFNTGIPDSVVSFVDRCGDFDPITGLIPRQNQFADGDFRIAVASDDVAQPSGAGVAPPVLVIPELEVDYAGAYRGLEVDWDDNIYVASGAVPAGQSGDPSPFTGSVLRIPDLDCDRVGNAVDLDGDGEFGNFEDYLWLDNPLNPGELTPNGFNSIAFGPLFSLQRVGLGLGDEETIAFAFDDFDGPANNVAGGICDLLLATACDNVGTQPLGGAVGFEFLICNTAYTGFRLGSNGNIAFRRDATPTFADPDLLDFSPTVVEFLSSTAPQVAPLFVDLNPGEGGQFSLHHLGFAAVDAFIIRYINMPEFTFGGVGVGVDQFGLPKRGSTNNFDVTFFDDQDFWDDVNAEILGDETNLNNVVNDDNDGICMPAGVGLDPNGPTQIIERNGDGDFTDENLARFSQEGVGRIKPEQGPFKFVYHQVESIGAANGSAAIVGFTTGFDGVFNTGTIPPGLCETNLSEAVPSPDNPFYMGGCIGMNTEPSLYEFFADGLYGFLNPDGTITPSMIDLDLRQETDPNCILRPEFFLDDTSEDCICFKGSNIPVGLFCQSFEISDDSAGDDPFLGPTTFQINGFCFPMPTTGENAICPQFCGQTAPLCRAGKSVTYSLVFKFDEDGDGITDATIEFTDPDVVVTNEFTIRLTVDFSQTNLCGGDVEVCIFAVYGFGDDNKYFELQQLDGDAPLEVAPVTLTCASTIDIGARAPVVLSIAPDTVACEDPDDPDNVEDVQIAGLCFFGSITSAFITTNPDGTGTRVDLSNVVNVQSNIVTATVPIAQLTPDTPYYVFVVRSDGVRSTSYPNAFGFDVTFTCLSEETPEEPEIRLTSCRVVRNSVGKLILQVNGENFVPNDSIVLLNGVPCRRNKYPARFINPTSGTTTRINCSGGLSGLLPATVTVRNQSDGRVSVNSLTCQRN